MTEDLGYERLAAGPLSLYELADLLGIHPHQLRTGHHLDNLTNQPIRALIDLCRHLDLHPADLIRNSNRCYATPAPRTP